MKNKHTHTLTPWKVEQDDKIYGKGEEGIIAMTDNLYVKEEVRKLNAEHIVKCVNAHDQAIQYLDRILFIIDEYNQIASRLNKNINETNHLKNEIQNFIEEYK